MYSSLFKVFKQRAYNKDFNDWIDRRSATSGNASGTNPCGINNNSTNMAGLLTRQSKDKPTYE